MAENEYIERELVETYLEESAEGLKGTPLFVELLLQCRDGVKSMPAADVVEVRHGKWRTAIEYKESRTTECSACHEEFWFMKKGQLIIDKMKYCPNCGAKMDGGKHETD